MEDLEFSPTSAQGRETLVDGIVSKLMRHEDKLSYSSLKSFWSSPKDFIDYKLKQKVTTPAMAFGQMLHCLVLEPEKFDERYHRLDDEDICAQIGGLKPRATKAYKEWKDLAIDEANGRTIVTAKDYFDALTMSRNVLYNRASAKILSMTPSREKPIEWDYENFLFRGFIDLDGDKVTGDLKIVPDASHRAAQRTIVKEGYYLQGAMYLTGLDAKKPYYIICCDKKGGVSVHLITDHLIAEGFTVYEMLIKQFNLCILEERFKESYDFWADRHDGIHQCDKPAFMY